MQMNKAKTPFHAALRALVGVHAAVAALTLSTFNNCASAQEWSPDDYKGNLTVEALFDWEVPVSVVASGAYESAWAAIPSDVSSQVELDIHDYDPVSDLDLRYIVLPDDAELPFYSDGDMETPWEDQLGTSPNLTGTGTGIVSLGTAELSFSELGNITTDLLDDDYSVVGSSFSVVSVNWGSFLKTELTPAAFDEFGISDAFASLSTSSPVLSWLADWYDEGVQTACNFVNRPFLTNVLRSVYSICCVAVFWVLAYTHLVKVLWGPLQAVLGSFGGGNK